MLSRRAKALFYVVVGPLMRMNGLIYRHCRAPKTGKVKVHLGPGQAHYIDGWLNVDANMFTGKCDLWADLRNPLPFRDNTADAFYSHHMIEHLPDIRAHLREVYRCLKPEGIYRVAAPNGDSAIAKFVEKDKEWFPGFPDDRRSLGGRLENFIFCRGEHLTIVTYSMMKEYMEDVGFKEILVRKPVQETGDSTLFGDCLLHEHESDYAVPHTLVIEARKPMQD